MPFNTPEKQKNYNQSFKRKMVLKKFNKNHPNYLKNWRKNNPDLRDRKIYSASHNLIYYQSHKEFVSQLGKKYRHSDKGKIVQIKHQSKRHRNLGFILISENIIKEKIVWHHIDNIHVATIPEDLHLLYSNPDKEKHRFMCNQIINQIYKGGGLYR